MSETKLFNIRLDVDDGSNLQKMAAQFDMSANNLAKQILTAGIKALNHQPGRLVLPMIFCVNEPLTEPALKEKQTNYRVKSS